MQYQDNNKFFDNTLDILKNAGWSNERKISKKHLEEKLIKEGYHPNSVILNFLSNYADLNCFFYNKRTEDKDDFSFNLDRAFELEVAEKINEDYYNRIKSNLCPIGTAYREHLVLLMDNEGKVYGAMDDYLVKIGNDYIFAINNIVNDIEFIEIG